ncbi:DUF4197 domain-containing protein [Flavimarina sp. Hel_I_48]|uniref:DUF4197 domain-containing protein n=1 Tax=Flavimarina sp. Hel_I_48 TaxID=1392488 RepID=UPI0004DF519E|nr:DUF4197 domain-containing protein [Flavimarina sp. Hel_I_48]
MKKILAILLVFTLYGCAELQSVVGGMPQIGVDNQLIATGLRQALDKGIEEQVNKLTEQNGFYNNELARILLPPELQKVDKTLRTIGLGSLADEGIKALNSAATDAVGQATPIFVAAVKDITFTDARNILLGGDRSATNYLEERTREQLYAKFNPTIKSSFEKVGAAKIWSDLITRYNNVPLTTNVNPDLIDYVTKEALDGVFNMIAVEEKDIRTSTVARTTTVLQRVFALQD